MTGPQAGDVVECEVPTGWVFKFDGVLSVDDMAVHRCLLIGLLFEDGRQDAVVLPADAAWDLVRALRSELDGGT